MIEDLTRAEYEALLRQDFATFATRCFHDLNPQTELAMNWHLERIAAKLTAVREGKIRRLIINLPPRYLKSLMASIAFPAWCLGHDSSAQFLSVCYGQDLADKLARDCRSIMVSPWYRQIFPTRLAAHRQAVQEFITTRQGYRLATSTGGVLTGRGADIILIDDPLKPEEALSAAQRQTTNEWYDHTLYSRLNDKRSGAIVIIMQRLHEDDLVGHVLAQEPWEVLRFPAIAEADEVHEIETIQAYRRADNFRSQLSARLPCAATSRRTDDRNCRWNPRDAVDTARSLLMPTVRKNPIDQPSPRPNLPQFDRQKVRSGVCP